MSSALPAKRLAGFYFFYYATVGAFMPYWGPYLEARGFNPVQMGIAFGLSGLARSIVPVLWGIWGDRAQSRVRLIRWAALASLILFMSIPFMPGVFWVGFMMIGYVLFWHALLPQFEVVALSHIHASNADYSRIRLWGSIGFVLAVLALGVALERTGILALPYLIGGCWVGMVWLAFRVPDAPKLAAAAGSVSESIWAMLKLPAVQVLLLVCLCSQMSFAAYYNFFTLFLLKHGYAQSASGLFWALAVVAEIGLFMVMSRLIGRYGARQLMIVAMAATALRWLLTAMLVDSAAALVLVQLSHALTFGAYHSVAMHYVQKLFPPALQGRGQAIYNAAAYGIGGSIGSLACGYLWDGVSPEAAFLVMALVALAGTWLAWKRLPAV